MIEAEAGPALPPVFDRSVVQALARGNADRVVLHVAGYDDQVGALAQVGPLVVQEQACALAAMLGRGDQAFLVDCLSFIAGAFLQCVSELEMHLGDAPGFRGMQ